ncbi:MAG: redoxin domain-containing protein [Planctomycetota bacterium]
MRHHLCLALLFLGWLIAAPNLADASDSNRRVDTLQSLAMRTPAGSLLELEPTKIKVFCFLGTECPLAKLYGPRLQAMSEKYEPEDVQFVGVVSNLQDSAEEILEYADVHSIRFEMVHDADQRIADVFGATRTPEVFVIDSEKTVRYQGRIDDQYSPGVARSKPTTHDLRDAIDALLAGRSVERSETTGVGCLITRAPRTPKQNPKATVFFHRNIAPILNNHCVECHREGEIGPMALVDYEEVLGWGDMILEVIDDKRMPPWHADADVGAFLGARRLPTAERDTIAKWIDEGMAEGDAVDAPPSKQWPSGWHLDSPPDLEITMRDQPYKVPADGVVEYQYFVVDPKWTEDRWVRAAQVIPGNRSVVHHSIVFVRPPDGARFEGIGWLGAYVPGQRAIELPPGHARLIPAGSKFVFQMHYTPNGTEADDITRLGIWLAETPKVTHRVDTHVAINHEFEIPPGETDFQVTMRYGSLPVGGRMLGITPHMHLRGKSFEIASIRADGTSQPLLRVPRYDFNWQHWYQFAEALELDGSEALEMKVSFDNSSENPFNPDPEEYVSWGDQTWQEMAVAFFDIATPRGQLKRRAWKKPTAEEIAAIEKKAKESAEAFFVKMDVDGDGVIRREETPATFRRFGFYRIDDNRDGIIDRSEAYQAALDRQ